MEEQLEKFHKKLVNFLKKELDYNNNLHLKEILIGVDDAKYTTCIIEDKNKNLLTKDITYKNIWR